MNGKNSKGLNNEIAEVGVSYENDSYNSYYDWISVLYRILSFAFMASFLIYIVVTSFKNASEFSYENFEYIIRNFALTLEENKDDSLYAIEYNPDANREYALFGKGLAVCGNSGVTVFSATGRQTCSESFPYKNPHMSASDKFVLIYDFDGFEYSLCNAFGKVYSERIEEKIRGGAVSDSGYYALVTSSEQYNTAVELYDDTFSLINRFNKNGFVVDIDLNDGYLVIATASESDNNVFVTEIQVFDIIGRKEVFSATSEGNFPLKCGISAIGFILAGSKYTVFYDHNGALYARYDYSDGAPTDLSLKDEAIALLFKNDGFNSEYRAVVFDTQGEVKYVKSFSSTVFDVEVYGALSYYLTEDKLICTDGKTEKTFSLEGITTEDTLLSFEDGKIYVCTATAAPLFVVPIE